MAAFDAALLAHLQTGVTTTCRCWDVTRGDGVRLGFTDHDRDLSFGGTVYRAGSGLTASEIEETTGLAANNSEALGVLSDAAITEADVAAGRYDGAEVRAWLVNWADVAARTLRFRGTIGEIRRAGGGFTAELRGLTEALNQARGRVYHRGCGAVLGDAACGVDLADGAFHHEAALVGAQDGRILEFAAPSHAERWFERGRAVVVSGAAAGLTGRIKNDRLEGAVRRVELWEAIRAPLAEGDVVRIEAGCDKRFETCGGKFSNHLNFRGFPSVPGEDWLTSYPSRSLNGSGA